MRACSDASSVGSEANMSFALSSSARLDSAASWSFILRFNTSSSLSRASSSSRLRCSSRNLRFMSAAPLPGGYKVGEKVYSQPASKGPLRLDPEFKLNAIPSSLVLDEAEVSAKLRTCASIASDSS